jgi:hypothetical protein
LVINLKAARAIAAMAVPDSNFPGRRIYQTRPFTNAPKADEPPALAQRLVATLLQ